SATSGGRTSRTVVDLDRLARPAAACCGDARKWLSLKFSSVLQRQRFSSVPQGEIALVLSQATHTETRTRSVCCRRMKLRTLLVALCAAPAIAVFVGTMMNGDHRTDRNVPGITTG